LVEYIPAEGPVIIGESATRIIEGEPFSHPKIKKILSLLREKFPQKVIKITSNGSLLEEDMIKFLKSIEPIELNISINGPDADCRVFLMNDPWPDKVFAAIEMLNQFAIKYQASIVAMPQLLGFTYLGETMDFLEKYEPDSLRIFRPGFTKNTEAKLQLTNELYGQLADYIADYSRRLNYPVILEPSRLKANIVNIIGVIAKSPAAKAGLAKDDLILKVNGIKPLSRVEAFFMIKNSKNPLITVQRKQKLLNISIKKQAKASSGIILAYDLPANQIRQLRKIVKNSKASIIITSQFAGDYLKSLVDSFQLKSADYLVLAVKNEFFGGSIKSAGLLTNQDIKAALVNQEELHKYQKIILPGIIYDFNGNDLTGEHYSLLEEYFAIDFEIIY